jgi:hypothetical protein
MQTVYRPREGFQNAEGFVIAKRFGPLQKPLTRCGDDVTKSILTRGRDGRVV